MAAGPDDQVPPQSRVLSAGPRTSSEARWFLLEALKDHDVSVDVGAAALLTGELASNAARYGGEPIGMSVSIEEAGLRVTVHDQGSGFDPLTVIEGSGGLRLVDKLSSKWGVEQTERGTNVWFEI